MFYKILVIIASNVPFLWIYAIIKTANSKKAYDYWSGLAILYNFCLEMELREGNIRKWGKNTLHKTDRIILRDLFILYRPSFFRFAIAYNPKHIIKTRDQLETVNGFAENGEYTKYSIGRIEELISKEDAILYAKCLYDITSYRERKLHKKRPHIFRGIFS